MTAIAPPDHHRRHPVTEQPARLTLAPPPIIVTGWGRCGTTMVMHMLAAGGVPWVPGTHPISGEIAQSPSRPALTARALAPLARSGHAIKLILGRPTDIHHRPTDADLIWCKRTPREQARSTRKFLATLDPDAPRPSERALADFYQAATPPALAAHRGRVHVLDYDHALTHPDQAAAALADFAGIPAALAPAMAAVVHQRRPECARGMDAEMTALASSSCRGCGLSVGECQARGGDLCCDWCDTPSQHDSYLAVLRMAQ